MIQNGQYHAENYEIHRQEKNWSEDLRRGLEEIDKIDADLGSAIRNLTENQRSMVEARLYYGWYGLRTMDAEKREELKTALGELQNTPNEEKAERIAKNIGELSAI